MNIEIPNLTDVQERFLSYTPLIQLLVYSIALKEERYELLSEIDPLVDDEFRKTVSAVDAFLGVMTKEIVTL